MWNEKDDSNQLKPKDNPPAEQVTKVIPPRAPHRFDIHCANCAGIIAAIFIADDTTWSITTQDVICNGDGSHTLKQWNEWGGIVIVEHRRVFAEAK